MKSFATLALAASVVAIPAPQSSASEGCQTSRDGTFQISVVNVTSSASKLKRRQADGDLRLNLKDGALKDQNDRTGSVVANHQFQFDKPIQEDALKTSGFCVYQNGSLALDGSAIWYQCLSGDFYNLYDQSLGEHCNPIYIVASGSGPVTQAADGQPAATTAVPAPVSQIPDGQLQASSAVPAPISQIGDGQVQAPTGAPISQIGDGQVQAPTGAPISQIGDGQIQAPAGAPISQIGDGQIQAPTGAPISQIGDGQIQAPTGTPAAPGSAVGQIGDGQIQAPVAPGNLSAPSASVTATPEFTGAASTPVVGAGAFIAGLFALVTLL